jgi:hypothetical protein
MPASGKNLHHTLTGNKAGGDGTVRRLHRCGLTRGTHGSFARIWSLSPDLWSKIVLHSVANLETGEIPIARYVSNSDVGNAREGGAFVGRVQYLLYVAGLTLNKKLNGSVGTVADPPGHAARQRLAPK